MKNERGQAMILLVFGILVLLAFTGLAVDGGRMYSGRRQSQNAADAAALAGARELAELIMACESGSAANDGQVALAVVDLARLNGVDHFSPDGHVAAWYVDANETRLGSVGFGLGIPDGATGVEVSLVLTQATTFMKALGRQDFVTPASAMAMAGPIKNFPGGGGLLPIGVPLEVINALDEDETFYMMENNKPEGGSFCRDGAATMCIGDPNAANANRGWLNLNYNFNLDHRVGSDPLNRSFEQNVPNRGCGSDPSKSVDDGVQGWSGDGCPYPFPIIAGTEGYMDGDFIHGSPGARQSSMQEVVETYNGAIAYVPIFDNIYMSDYMKENFTAPEEPVDGSLGGDHWPNAGGGGSAFLYHIVGFAAVEIDDPNSKDHVLVGNFKSSVIGQSEIQPGGGLNGSGGICGGTPMLYGIVLWK